MNSRIFWALPMVLFLHQVGVGLAVQPLFTFLRTVVSETQIAAVTFAFPIGATASFFFARRYDKYLARHVSVWLLAAEALNAMLFLLLYSHCKVLVIVGATHIGLLPIAISSFLLGLGQTLAWCLLLGTVLRAFPWQFPYHRGIASFGWFSSGVMLANIPNASGASLVVGAGFLLFAAVSAMFIRPCSVAEIPKRVASTISNEIGLTLIVVATLSSVETRFLIHAQSYLLSALGESCNYFLMTPVGLEIVLLIWLFPKAQKSPKVSATLLVIGPLSWTVVAAALIAYGWMGRPALVGLAFLAFNVLFQGSVACRLPASPAGQAALPLAQAVGGLGGYVLAFSDAWHRVEIGMTWISCGWLSVGATILMAAALKRKPCSA